jgi:3'(2'), 5'-bisphosphate nucleotidase
MIDLSQAEVSFALDVVRKAGQLAQRVQSGMALQGLTKSDFSPVTVGDFAIQAVVAHALEQQFPGAVLVAEERADELRAGDGKMLSVVTEFVSKIVEGADGEQVCAWIDQGTAEPSERFWTLDPIDGTKGYMRGGQYAVALALIEDGEVKLGVLGCPNLGESCQPETLGMGALLVAQRGQGAWSTCMSDPDDDFHRLSISDCADPVQARLLRSVESAHTNTGQIDEIARHLGVQAEPVLMDSQAKYATLAAGHGELLFRMLSAKQPDYKEKIWDQAAGSIVLEEAGGRITDLNGKDLDFRQGRTLASNSGVFASNGRLHDAGLQALAKLQ